MATLRQTSIALIIVAAIGGLFLNSVLFSGSTDTNKREFTTYDSSHSNSSSLLNMGNVSYQNQNNTQSNFEWIANKFQVDIVTAQTNWNNGDVVTKLASAFGLVMALTINLLVIMVAAIGEGTSFAFGMVANISSLPAPWSMVGVLGLMGTVLILVYMAFLLVRAIKTGDTI